MINDRAAFLAKIRENPGDDTPRLVYADWLAEREDHAEEFAQRQAAHLIRIRRDPDDDAPRLAYADWLQEHDGPDKCVYCDASDGYTYTPCNRCGDTGRVSNGLAERAEFIRVQCELASKPDCDHPARAAEWYGPGKLKRSFTLYSCPVCKLRLRERELLEVMRELLRPEWESGKWIFAGYDNWDRGFVSDIEIPWGPWLDHHAAIFASPYTVIRRVVLTTWPEFTRGQLRTLRRGSGGAVNSTMMDLCCLYPDHCPNHPIEFVLPGTN